MASHRIVATLILTALVLSACGGCENEPDKPDASFDIGQPTVTFQPSGTVFDATIDMFVIEIPMTSARRSDNLVADFTVIENGQAMTIHAVEPLVGGAAVLSMTASSANTIDGTITTDGDGARKARFSLAIVPTGIEITVDGVVYPFPWP